MKFSFKKIKPYGQDEFIPGECGCSSATCGDGPIVCYPGTNDIIVGPGAPPGFEPDYGNQGYCADDCGGCLVNSGPEVDYSFDPDQRYGGGPYDLYLNGSDPGDNYYDFTSYTECSPGETMYLSGPLPCVTITGGAGQNQPAVVKPQNFGENFDYGAIARYYQYYVGVFPVKAYSSLPGVAGTTLRAAKIDITQGWSQGTRSRLMVLSAYNRYRYIGPLATNCIPALKWRNLAPNSQGTDGANYEDFVGLSAGSNNSPYVANWRGDLYMPANLNKPRTIPLYGIIKLEEAIHGEFPHPDWKMQLPLFGGTAPADSPKEPPGGAETCCPAGSPCTSLRECAAPAPPYDENLRQGDGTPIGYFMHPFRNWSARPYNPDCHLGRARNPGIPEDYDDPLGPGGESPARRVHAPHCSLYSLFWAIRNYVFIYANQVFESEFLLSDPFFPVSSYWLNWNAGVDPEQPDQANGMPGLEGSAPWYNLDPAGYQFDAASPNNRTMNPIYVMEQMLQNMPGFMNHSNSAYAYTKLQMLIPRILLWDEAGYNSATTNKDKWKHIYIPGNLNIMYDTGCVTFDGLVFEKRRGMYLDSTSHRHDARGKKEDSARILYIPACACDEEREFETPYEIFYTNCNECGGGDTKGGPLNYKYRRYTFCLLPCNFTNCGDNDPDGPRYWFGGYNRYDGFYDNFDFGSCWTLTRGMDFEGDSAPYGWDDLNQDGGFPECP